MSSISPLDASIPRHQSRGLESRLIKTVAPRHQSLPTPSDSPRGSTRRVINVLRQIRESLGRETGRLNKLQRAYWLTDISPNGVGGLLSTEARQAKATLYEGLFPGFKQKMARGKCLLGQEIKWSQRRIHLWTKILNNRVSPLITSRDRASSTSLDGN